MLHHPDALYGLHENQPEACFGPGKNQLRHKDGTILNAMDSVIHITIGPFPNTVTWVKILLIFGHGLFLMITVTLLGVDRG